MRTTAVARHLAVEGYRVEVVVPSASGRAMKNESVNHYLDGDVQITYLKSPQNYRRSFFHRLWFEISVAISTFKYLRRSDASLILAAYPPAFMPLVGLFATKLSNIPFILEVRDLMAGALAANNYTKSKLLLWLAGIYESSLFKFSKGIAVVSPGMVQHISTVVNRERILRSYNGIENTTINFSSDAPEAIKLKLETILGLINYSTEDKLVIYAGALTQSYDLETILLGFELANVPMKKLLILGDGERKVEYEDLVSTLRIQNVYFHGFVDRRVALELMRRASVGVHAFNDSPHWAYVLGNKVFDYMAMGLPVLFSGLGTTADLVKESRGGKVSLPSSPEDFATQLQCLLEAASLSEIGNRGRSYVYKNWTREQQLNVFVEDLKSFLDANNYSA